MSTSCRGRPHSLVERLRHRRVVALGKPLRQSWGDPLTDVEVENGADSHSISRYLAHPEVAGPIGAAMRDGT